VALLFKDVQDALAPPAVREQLRAQGLSPVVLPPADFAAHMRAETATWARIIKARQIVAE
jgi:tripartite-type tricarboxylate transporter receptor subunit TctC